MQNTIRSILPWIVFSIPAVFACAGLLHAIALGEGDSPPADRQLGRIHWQNDLTKATAISKSTKKPLLLLSCGSKACQKCVGYGDTVLTNPLIVEAAETLFVPVAIIHDDENHSCNPTLQISDSQEPPKEKSGDIQNLSTLTRSMIAALEKSNLAVPNYLKLLDQEESARADGKSEHAGFAMYCFWSGEVKLGSLDGVIRTKPGFAGHREVVYVEFNPQIISLKSLTEKAESQEIDSFDNSCSLQPDPDPKYYMSKTALKFLPMTHAQAARVNAAVGKHEDFKIFLSPAQIALLKSIEQNPHAGWPDAIDAIDFSASWYAARKISFAQN